MPEPDNDLDPAASTQMFQAFVDRYENEESDPPRSRRVALVVAALAALGILLVLAWLVL